MPVCDSISQVFEGSEPRDHFWLGGFSTRGCRRFVLLAWWAVAGFRGVWGRLIVVQMGCIVICCEIWAVFSSIGIFGWSMQVSSVAAILAPTWLHNVRVWADVSFDNDGRVPHFGSWAGCHSHLVTWAQGWKITCRFAVMVEFLICFLVVQTLRRLGGCMLWVWVAHEERGICSSGVCPSVAVLETDWLQPAGLSCNPGGQVAYQWLSSRDALLSAQLFRPPHRHWEGGGLKSCGQCRMLCTILQIL